MTKRALGRYDTTTRLDILRRLIARRRQQRTLAEYLYAVDHAISRQQALADLQSCAELRPSGHGRGARRIVQAMLHPQKA